jgi:hypothetical protein
LTVGSEGRIYIIGGCINGSTSSITRNNYYYVPSTDTWSSLQANAPHPRFGHARENSVYDGKIWYSFGQGPSGHYWTDTYAYDPSTDTWHQYLLDGVQARDGVAGALVGSKYYIIGGRYGTTQYATNCCVDLSTIASSPEDLGAVVKSGNLTLASDVKMSGNVTMTTGTFTPGLFTVYFAGSSPQVIDVPSGTSFYNVTIAASADVTIDALLTVNGTITGSVTNDQPGTIEITVNNLTIVGTLHALYGWAHTINGVSVPAKVNGVPGPSIYSINGVVR